MIWLPDSAQVFFYHIYKKGYKNVLKSHHLDYLHSCIICEPHKWPLCSWISAYFPPSTPYLEIFVSYCSIGLFPWFQKLGVLSHSKCQTDVLVHFENSNWCMNWFQNYQCVLNWKFHKERFYIQKITVHPAIISCSWQVFMSLANLSCMQSKDKKLLTLSFG
jgi:hypothetical protein